MHQKTEKFLETFNQLEEALKRQLGKDKFTPFSMLLREASKRDSYIRMHRSILESFSDLRNVLVHKEGSEVIAIPSDKTLERLTNIVATFTKSKSIYDVCQKKIVIVSTKKSLQDGLALMKQHDYTKIPVYEGHTYHGLLSGNVVSRWFASSVGQDGIVTDNLKDVTVANVIESFDKRNQVQFVKRHMPVFEFLHLSERKPSKSGVYIITENGNSHEKPVGIITTFDYKRLLDSLLV